MTEWSQWLILSFIGSKVLAGHQGFVHRGSREFGAGLFAALPTQGGFGARVIENALAPFDVVPAGALRIEARRNPARVSGVLWHVLSFRNFGSLGLGRPVMSSQPKQAITMTNTMTPA